MPALIDQFDWGTTPLGPKNHWSQALLTSYTIMMETGFAACATWGPEKTLLYNAGYIPFLGQKHPAALGQPIDRVWSEIWNDIEPLVDRTMQGETSYLEDLPLTVTRSGAPEETFWTFSYSPLRDGERVMGMLDIAIETTGRVRAERHRQLLVDECGHRVKNILAMVQAVARSSLKGVDKLTVADFGERLQALARAQDALDEKAWNGGDLGEIITISLGNLSRRPFEISGPDVSLSPRVAQTVSLVIHELATNAFKHGALSTEAGRVSVHWTVADGHLALVWLERGGPPVLTPATSGFGTKLLRRGLAGSGGVELTFEPNGFCAAFAASLDQLTAS